MSNIIRNYAQETSPNSKKIIETRKVEMRKIDYIERDIDPQQERLNIKKSIAQLNAEQERLKIQLEVQKQEASEMIDQWWIERKEEAEQEAQRLAEEAAIEGFQAGYDKGMVAIKEQFEQKNQEMTQLLELAYSEKANIIQQAEPFLLSLSVTIAEKVIHNELQQDTQQVIHIIQQALKQVEESEDVTMQVCPEDYPLIIPFLEELKTYIKADSELKVIPVANLTPGGCRIHTASGSYDAMVDNQLEEIKNKLLAYCEEKTNDELVGR
ncbi:flagellar assembly protein FliH [Planococcus sp. PAMC 21323]|uniref:FliH/SctL family protein n=1 Tax=Planococcus sp. PAMC 21323 TaxID=1526927 RepID=UPI0005705DB0|nr:FliH/SctL family protein [Planococcus sp. PAMC 21323]AIY04093.1 flagellar assembly protein FliH [Planococcus sp. PAMC 21323]